jgi:endo-1,4-beta-xylanase
MRTIRATVAAEDRSDPHPDIRLVSISSNQPADAPGLGDGSTAPDIDGAIYATDDRSFMVRDERDGSRQRV